MLTIGKIGNDRKQQLYYDDTVAQGAEDYYSGKGEAPGSWHGETAAELGLTGAPTAGAAAADVRRPSSGDG